jgi:hypothetical protein
MRRTLPQRRPAETFDMRFWNQPFTVTVGFYADGTPAIGGAAKWTIEESDIVSPLVKAEAQA